MRKRIKLKDKYEWHEWFAWYPIWVQVGPCKETFIFLEKVQRKYTHTWNGVVTKIRNLDGTDIK